MSILCIETGTDVCSVGLARDGQMVALRESSQGRDHARHVAVFAQEVMAETGESLDAVAVSKGPGSYTGLRIGVSFAKGLCYGLGIPLIGIGSLDAVTVVAKQQERFCSSESKRVFIPMIDARRMEVFTQIFDDAGHALTPVEALIINEDSFANYRDKDVLIFGSGAEKCREMLPWARFAKVQPSARGMVSLATQALAAGKFEDLAYFEPFYLKDFVINTSQKKIL